MDLPRAAWKGHLRISLVTFQVQAYVGTESDNPPVRLNQLHRECHSRIKYQKTARSTAKCPTMRSFPCTSSPRTNTSKSIPMS